jgi:hypothetical protein
MGASKRTESDHDSHDRHGSDGRERGRFFAGLAWLAVLIGGLSAAGGLVYVVYRALSGLFSHYDAPEP